MPNSAAWSLPAHQLVGLFGAVRRTLNRHGVSGVLGKAVQVAGDWRKSRGAVAEPDAFDVEFGTDTAGVVPLWKLHIDGPHREHGVRYQAVDPARVRRCLAALPIRFSNYTYVDLGSGKGRSLLVASEFPFQRVIGVEFAAELHTVAEQNLRRFPSTQRRCRSVESVYADAAAFDLPRSDLVLFLYNPFGAEVLEAVVERLERSLEAHDRSVYVVYHNPVERRLFDASTSFEALPDGGETAFFVHRPRTATAKSPRSQRGPERLAPVTDPERT